MTRYIETAADRAALVRALAAHPVHDIPPEGSVYRFGKVHRDRGTLKGYAFEARKAVRHVLARLKGQKGAARRFVILARPRSGSTLLVDLLTQVEGLHCDREILHYAVARPAGVMNDLAAIRPAQTYGCKILSYQLFEIQRLRDHLAFFDRLGRLGFVPVHLRRDTFAQSLSLSRSLQTGSFERRGQGLSPDVEIDPEAFRRMLDWNAAMLSYEDMLMSGFTHLRVDYETDLAGAEAQQRTVDEICSFVGHPPSLVRARTRPTTEGGGGRILNIDALRRVAEAAGYL